MKRFVLLLSFFPGLLFAQQVPDRATHRMKAISQLADWQQPAQLRADAATAVLDSVYTYQREERILTDVEHHVYDDAGRKVLTTNGHVSNGDGRVVYGSKVEYTYASLTDRLPAEELELVYGDGVWQETTKVLNGYNAAGFQIDVREYSRRGDTWNKSWFTISKEFNAQGYPTLLLDSTFNDDGTVDEVMKLEAAYNEKSLLSDIATSEWDKTTQTWIPTERCVMTYDANGNCLTARYTSPEDAVWIPSFATDYTYDERKNMTSEISTEADGTTFFMYYTNFYSDQVTTANEQTSQSPVTVRIYPNPAVESVTIDLGEPQRATLSLINSTGVLLKRIPLDQQISTLPVQAYPAGYYILQLSTAKGIEAYPLLLK